MTLELDDKANDQCTFGDKTDDGKKGRLGSQCLLDLGRLLLEKANWGHIVERALRAFLRVIICRDENFLLIILW